MTKTETDTETLKKESPSSETLMKEGYKKTKVGWIPKEWEVKKLANICKVTSGGTPNRKKPEYWNGDIPWITTSMIDFNKLYWADEFITKEGLSNSSAKLFDPGTVLIALYGQGVTRGKAALLKIKATTNQACAALIPQKHTNSDYLFQLLIFHYRRMRWISNDGSQKNLSGKLLKNYRVPLPPLPEQKEIADILSTWDRAIETLEQLIAKKEELKKGLMQQLLTGEKRFPGFEGEWNKVKAGKLFNFLRSISVSRKDLDENSSEETVLNLHYGDLHVKYNSMTMLDVGNSNDIPSIVNGYNYPSNIDYAKDGDVIIVDASEDYEGVGECVELKNVGEKKLTAGLHTFLLRDKMDLTVEGFRSLIFEQPAVKKQLKRLVTGSNVFGLAKSNLAKVEVDLPSKEEQRKIVETLQGIESEIGSLKIMRDTFEVQKKGLMQQLLTGKKRVNEIKTE